MNTDISIKPVGLSTASSFISSSNAARSGVPAQLPPQQAVTPADASTRPGNTPKKLAEPVINKVKIDRDAAAIVFQTVDDRTSEVIGQYPAEGMLRRRAYIRALDQARTDLDKAIPIDRKA